MQLWHMAITCMNLEHSAKWDKPYRSTNIVRFCLCIIGKWHGKFIETERREVTWSLTDGKTGGYCLMWRGFWGHSGAGGMTPWTWHHWIGHFMINMANFILCILLEEKKFYSTEKFLAYNWVRTLFVSVHCSKSSTAFRLMDVS
jgi:hypothetical protein